jgi:virulence-associated protein VagC
MLRRLFTTGNSVVLSLPKEIPGNLGLMNRENVSLELDRQQRRVILTPVDKPLAIAGVDEDFARQDNDFVGQDLPALEELAK